MTIEDIAKMAGVSKAAVSRYFNNGYISEEKSEAIRKVVEETGYVPSLQAKGLRTKKSYTIGVIAPKMASYSVGRMTDGMLGIFNEHNYNMILAVTQNNYKKEIEYLKKFKDMGADGVILLSTVFTPEHKKLIKTMDIPVIIIGQKIKGMHCVYHDDYHAMYEITQYMIKEGVKNPCYIGVIPEDKAAGKERFTGFEDALETAGMREKSTRMELADFTLESGYKCAKALYENYGEMDAIICATDEIALGAQKYIITEHPEDIRNVMISGIGGSTLIKLSGAPILTARYFFKQSGEYAAQMVMDCINGKDKMIQDVMMGYELLNQI